MSLKRAILQEYNWLVPIWEEAKEKVPSFLFFQKKVLHNLRFGMELYLELEGDDHGIVTLADFVRHWDIDPDIATAVYHII